MPVTDEQVAALRALLALNPPEAERLTRQLVEAIAWTATASWSMPPS